jgi:hypothetical protein
MRHIEALVPMMTTRCNRRRRTPAAVMGSFKWDTALELFQTLEFHVVRERHDELLSVHHGLP